MNSSSKKVLPQPLSQEAFQPFGDVIEANDKVKNFPINDGFSQRYHDLAKLDLLANQGKVLLNIFRSTPVPTPIVIEKMERHPLSSQAFMPLGTEPYLVVVAAAGDFNEEAIQVFLASSDQGVNYHAGTWHHFSLALNHVSDFLVIDRGADATAADDGNCDEIILKTPLTIELAP